VNTAPFRARSIGKQPGDAEDLQSDRNRRPRRPRRCSLPGRISGTGKGACRADHPSAQLSPRAAFFICRHQLCGHFRKHLARKPKIFGHEKGAFHRSGRDRAPGLLRGSRTEGRLFLDEIGEMTPATQVKLLRGAAGTEVQGDSAAAMSKRSVRASHRGDQHRSGRGGAEREAARGPLFTGSNVFAFKLPPLRERKEEPAPPPHPGQFIKRIQHAESESDPPPWTRQAMRDGSSSTGGRANVA